MRFLTEKARSLTPYTAGIQPQETGWIKLNTNENPYPPSPKVTEVIKNADLSALRLYPDGNSSALSSAIAANSPGISKENVFCGNGSDEVLALAYQAFYSGKSGVLTPDISYGFYPVWGEMYDVGLEKIPLGQDFNLDPSDYKNAPGVIIANPNAPTSLGVGLSAIERILCQNPDGVVLVDEAYIDFADSGCETAASLVADYKNLLIVRTFSKSYSLAGIRVGYALGQTPLIDGLKRVRDAFNSYPLDMLAQSVAIAALEDDAYLQECTKRIINTRNKTAESLRNMGYRVLPSQCNFIFMQVPDAAGLYEHLLKNKILARYWNKPRINDYLRVSIGTEEEMEGFVKFVKAFR